MRNGKSKLIAQRLYLRATPPKPMSERMSDTEHRGAALAPTIGAEKAVSINYDAVIVGSGISGSILAYELTSKGHRVLILEAGLGRDLSQHGYERYLETFYSNPYRDNNSPF